MRRILIVLIAMAMLAAMSGAAVAAPWDCETKPNHPSCESGGGGGGGGPTHPPLCDPNEPFVELPEAYSPYQVIVVGGKVRVADFNGFIPLTELKSRTEPDLCVEVELVYGGPLADMNVALVDYPDLAARRCGFYWLDGR
jgi:hypothetical protein